MVSFEDFKKLDIRVGEVLKAEEVEEADNLLKVEVDIGEKRQVVAGLRPDYSPEDLEGMQVVLLANLEPKEIFGIESQGMILAVDGDDLSLLTTDKEVEKGSEVS